MVGCKVSYMQLQTPHVTRHSTQRSDTNAICRLMASYVSQYPTCYYIAETFLVCSYISMRKQLLFSNASWKDVMQTRVPRTIYRPDLPSQNPLRPHSRNKLHILVNLFMYTPASNFASS